MFLFEKSLAIDNIFIISIIFITSNIPNHAQRKTLFHEILRLVTMRDIMIALRETLISKFNWIFYVFSVILIYSGIKLIFTSHSHKLKIEDNKFLNFLKKYLSIKDELHNEDFYYTEIENNKEKTYFTKLFIALILIGMADMVCAIESIPAIFSITKNTFIIYTSNIFAILGLRAIYFVLAAMVDRFEYLKYSLSLILVFIELKVFIMDFFNIEQLPTTLSLSVTSTLLIFGITYSLYKTKNLISNH